MSALDHFFSHEDREQLTARLCSDEDLDPKDFQPFQLMLARNEIERVGDNSLSGFLEQRHWACVFVFPEQQSNRANFFAECFRQMIMPHLADRHSDYEFNVNFAFKNYQETDRAQDMLEGDPLRIEFYHEGKLVTQADDSLFLGDAKICDGKIVNSGSLRNDVEEFDAWLQSHGVLLEPPENGRELLRENLGNTMYGTEAAADTCECK